MKKNTKEPQDLINDALTAGVRAIICRDSDSQRAIHAAITAAKAHSEVKVQVITSTSRPLNKEGKETNGTAMDTIEAHKKTGTGILVCVNILQSYGHSPLAVALLKELASEVKDAPYPRIILVESKSTKVPEILKDDVELINVRLPDTDAQEKEAKDFLASTKRTLPGNGEAIRKVAEALSGVDGNIGSRLCSQSIVETGTLDAQWIAEAKAERLQEMSGGMLTIMRQEDANVGGLANLVKAAAKKAKAFCSAKAKAFGLNEPKGFFLTGIPGCGKTLFAKWMGKHLGVPVVRWDLAKVFGGIVGDTEKNVEAGIEAVEAMSPCVLLLDECDKAFAGATGPSGDSGTTQRMFGTMLTWLQERKKPVFIVATSNNARSLPPEVMRKGRFDEVFFIDLPTEQERAAIIAIHIKASGYKSEDYDLIAIAKATEGFSGAEIEQVAQSGLELAFFDDRAVTTKDFVDSAESTNPLSKTQSEKITELREWAKTMGVRQAGEGVAVRVSAAPATTTDGKLKRSGISFTEEHKPEGGK